MGIFNENMTSNLGIENQFQAISSNIGDTLLAWNEDFWRDGRDRTTKDMEEELEWMIKALYGDEFKKSNLDPMNIYVFIHKNKHGFTGYDITVEVKYLSPKLCCDMVNVSYGFDFYHPGFV